MMICVRIFIILTIAEAKLWRYLKCSRLVVSHPPTLPVSKDRTFPLQKVLPWMFQFDISNLPYAKTTPMKLTPLRSLPRNISVTTLVIAFIG